MHSPKSRQKPEKSRAATNPNKPNSPHQDSDQALHFGARPPLHGLENNGYGSDTNTEGSVLTSVRRSQDVFKAKENDDSVPNKHNDRDLLLDDNDDDGSDRYDVWSSKLTYRSPKIVASKKNNIEERYKPILPTWSGASIRPPSLYDHHDEEEHYSLPKKLRSRTVIERDKEKQELAAELSKYRDGRGVKGNMSMRKLHIGEDGRNDTLPFSPFDGHHNGPENISEGLNETLPSMGEVVETVEQGKEKKQNKSTRKGKNSKASENTTPKKHSTPSPSTNDSKPATSPTTAVEKRKTVSPLTIRLNIKDPKASVVTKKGRKTSEVDKDAKIIDSDKKDTNTDSQMATVATEAPVAAPSPPERKRGRTLKYTSSTTPTSSMAVTASPEAPVATPSPEAPSSERKRGRTLKPTSSTTPNSSKNKKEPKKKISQEPLDRNDVTGATGNTPKKDSSISPKKTVKATPVATPNGSKNVVKKEPVSPDATLDLGLNDSNRVSVKRELVDGRRQSNGSNKKVTPRRKIKRELVDDSFGDGQGGQGQSTAGNPSKRVRCDEQGEEFDMTIGVADWDDVKFAGMSEVLKVAEKSGGNKLTTIAPKVQAKLFKTDSVYYVDRIVHKIRDPRNNKDPVFIVQWLHWNDTADTMCSIEDLRGSKDEFKAFSSYEKAVKVLYEECCAFEAKNSKWAPEKPEYKMLTSTGFCSKWMSDSWWRRQRKSPNFSKSIGLNWYLKVLEREWTTILRSYQPFAGGLRLLTFYKFPISREFHKFRYIGECEYTRKVKEFIASEPIRDGCTCSCLKFCKNCKQGFNNEIVQLCGDRMRASQLQLMASSFATLRCGPRSSCPADAPCRRLPTRRAQLLISYVPKIQGLGVFAVEPLRPGDILGEYVGEVNLLSEINPEASRNYQYEITNNLVIEARYAGNETRFVNHSCDPNVKTIMTFQDNAASCPRVFFVVVKDIQPGQQLFVDYHPDYNDKEPIPIGSSKCYCGSKACRGWL